MLHMYNNTFFFTGLEQDKAHFYRRVTKSPKYVNMSLVPSGGTVKLVPLISLPFTYCEYVMQVIEKQQAGVNGVVCHLWG